jgi:hypothetical protein
MMPRREDIQGKRLAIGLASGIAVALILVGLGIYFLGGPLAEHFEPGVGLKTAAVIAFFVTIGVFVTLAVTAGDGLIGEFQFMIAGFGGFFVVLWLMIAWIF